MIRAGSVAFLIEEIAKAMSDAPTSKKDAVAAGSKLMVGNPCSKCGCKVKYTRNNSCRYCALMNRKEYSGDVGVKSKANQVKWKRFDDAISNANLKFGVNK